MIIETYIDIEELENNQSLVILDDLGKRWDVLEALSASRDPLVRARPHEVILERWRIELGPSSSPPPPDLGTLLPTVYKKSIVLFRSLYTYARFLPAWRIAKRSGTMRTNPALKIKYRIREAVPTDDSTEPDGLSLPLHAGSGKVAESYSFGTIESPAGPFSVQVTYRISCDFRVDDSEALLSSRFMGADDDFFRPSLPAEEAARIGNQEPGSVPVTRRGLESPDRTRAYGSLSTYHQVGPTTGASPISTLRAARDLGPSSPDPQSPSQKLQPAAKLAKGRAAALAGDGELRAIRRPSISFQPFKAPPLSASPSLADAPLGGSPRTGSAARPPSSGPSADAKAMPPPSSAPSHGRKATPDQIVPSSTSSSPRPAGTPKYSSSFSHRRGRLSSGGIHRPDEDNVSSGKTSAASSHVQPGSGLLAEAAGGMSGDSLQTDDDNISDFLKLLDSRKDLLAPNKATSEAATRRTSALLSRYQRMRDSNAALSDSMTSSLLLHRSSGSSASRQLSNVPPMVGGASVSSASSPGKPISPHTPHTPAIPSRLSSNSVVNYPDPEVDVARQGGSGEPGPVNQRRKDADEIPQPAERPVPNAIDIPKSPRPYGPSYQRPISVAEERRPSSAGRTAGTGDDEDIFPFGMRSISLGAEDRPQPSLSGLAREQESLNTSSANPSGQPPDQRELEEDASNPASQAYRDFGSQRGVSESSTAPNHPNQRQFSFGRGRGSSGGPHSHSSSGSLPAGSAIPSHLVERERERESSGSGSNSGYSFSDARRGSHRSSITRPHTASFDDEEPLLFAMSDFGASRRSLEDRRGSGNESGGVSAGSRRGSGRRGAGLPNFQGW